MTWTWYLIAVVVLTLIIRRASLRKQMLFAALFAAPIVLVQPILTGNWTLFSTSFGLLIAQTISIVSLAALAAALYALFLNTHISPLVHPDRRRLGWLILSPFATIVVALAIHQPVISGLLAAIVLDLIVVVIMRRDLLWDVIVSGTGFGMLYAGLFLTATIVTPGEWSPLILSQQSIGVTVFSVPIEELLFVLLLGAVIGPLYAATKHARLAPTERIGVGSPRLKVALGMVILSLSVIATAWTVVYVVIPPGVTAAEPASAVPLTYQPTIHFSRPISRQRIEVAIVPHVEGQVVFDQPAFSGHAFRTARFIPTVPFAPSTTYELTFSGIGSLAGVGTQTSVVRYTTVSLPNVVSVGGSEPANPCGPISAVLDRAIDATATFSFSLEPDGIVTAALGPDSRTYLLTPSSCLRQGATYTVHAWRQITLSSADGLTSYTSDREDVASLPVTTASEPQLVSVTPNGASVPLATSQIVLTFADAMPPDDILQHIVLEPPLAGQWSWQDDRHLMFAATEPLREATIYRVTIPAGTTSVNGGRLVNDLVATFATIGPIPVPSVTPSNGTKGYTTSGHVRLTFGQPIDQQSVAAAFSLNPEVDGDITWQGTTMEFVPRKPFAHNATYTIQLAAGVTGPGSLPSTATLTSVFTTETSRVVLSIPLDYQDQALSCEAAALKMALAGKGVTVSERDIMNLVGYDRTPHRGNVWGDPDSAFVGLITGKQNTTGYGVNWGPIAKAARQWRPATAFSGWKPAQLSAEIAKGNPVVIWGVVGKAYADPWKTPSGKTVKAWKGEHVRTVVGYIGPVDAPTAFVINDPYVGRITWTTATLTSNWATFGNSGVLVE